MRPASHSERLSATTLPGSYVPSVQRRTQVPQTPLWQALTTGMPLSSAAYKTVWSRPAGITRTVPSE